MNKRAYITGYMDKTASTLLAGTTPTGTSIDMRSSNPYFRRVEALGRSKKKTPVDDRVAKKKQQKLEQ